METQADQIFTGSGLALASFIGYLLVITLIGVVSTKFSSSGIREYFIGGRRMNFIVVAFSAVVSGRSAWLLLGFSGMAYSRGMSAIWAAVGYITVEFFLFFFYAARLRRFSEAYDCLTVPDFFAARFPDKRNALRSTLSLIIILFLTGYISAQFVGGGTTFAASFNLDPTVGLILTAVIVLVYTLLGGFLAVSLTDFLQAIIMLVALFALPLIAIVKLGGVQAVQLSTVSDGIALFDPMAITFGGLIGFIGIGLGSPGNPHIIVRYMSIKDPKQLRTAAIIGTLANIIMAAGALFIGLLGHQFVLAGVAENAENVYPALARELLHPLLFGVVVASIFAAIMSTADSQLLVAASSVVVDFYQKIMGKEKEISEKKLVGISRLVVLILVVLAVLFGMVARDLVFWLVLFTWAGLGAAIGPTSILALYWKRATGTGILAGALTGAAVTIIWRYIPALKSFLYELIPAFILGALVTIIVSLLTSPPEDAESMMNTMTEDHKS